MPIRSSRVFQKVVELGESQVGKLAGQLLANEKFVTAIQGIVARTLAAKGTLDKSLRMALATMNLPSTGDVERLRHKLEDVERVLAELESSVARLERRLDDGGGKGASA